MQNVLFAIEVGPEHMQAGQLVIIVGMGCATLVAIVCIVGGVMAIIRREDTSETKASIFDQGIVTKSKGVAFVFIGVAVMGGVIYGAYKTLYNLGALPANLPVQAAEAAPAPAGDGAAPAPADGDRKFNDAGVPPAPAPRDDD